MPDENAVAPGKCTASVNAAGVLIGASIPRIWCELRAGHTGRHHGFYTAPGAVEPSTVDWLDGVSDSTTPELALPPFRGPVSLENFAQAMRLLGLNPDDPERALIKVEIEGGRVTATYHQIERVGTP